MSGSPRWLRWLYAAAVAALLVPIWAAPRFATRDGPCHVYNAWILHHLHDPAFPQIERHFWLSLAPVPNWLIQGLLYVLLPIAAPAVAEQLLLSLYVVFFGGVAWWFAGCQAPGRRIHALLAVPFVYNLTVHFGFYNFIFSVPLALLAVGLWWRWRDRLSWRRGCTLSLILLACYFAHLVALVVALLVIGVLWLATLQWSRWRQWLLHPLLLAPQLILPLWYVLTHASTPSSELSELGLRWTRFTRLQVLFSFQHDNRLRAGLALLFLVLALLTLASASERRDAGATASGFGAPAARPWRERHAFLLAAMAVIGLFFVVPEGLGVGGFLPMRLMLFPFLLAIPGLTCHLGRWIPGTLAAALGLLLGWQVVGTTQHNRVAARGVEAYLAGLAGVPSHSRLLALPHDRDVDLASDARTHASSWMAAEKGLVDWDNYQAASDVFPVRFRPGMARPDGFAFDDALYEPARYAAIVDYLYLWRVPAGSPLRPRVRQVYRLVEKQTDWQLWRRKGRIAAAPQQAPTAR